LIGVYSRRLFAPVTRATADRPVPCTGRQTRSARRRGCRSRGRGARAWAWCRRRTPPAAAPTVGRRNSVRWSESLRYRIVLRFIYVMHSLLKAKKTS